MNAPMSYYGGKSRLAPIIAQYFPYKIEMYVEPFFGAGSLFFHTPTQWADCEIINDVNEDVINFFRQLRDRPKKLVDFLKMFPHSRREYLNAWDCLNKTRKFKNDIERAAMFYVVKQQSYSNVGNRGSWSPPGRAKIRSMEWMNDVKRLEGDLWNFVKRLQHASLECYPALRVIKLYDKASTFFYLDPPYLLERAPRQEYHGHDMDEEAHINFVDACLKIKGMAIISGYETAPYKPLTAAGWKAIKIKTLVNINVHLPDARKQRTEILWINPRLQETQKQKTLF